MRRDVMGVRLPSDPPADTDWESLLRRVAMSYDGLDKRVRSLEVKMEALPQLQLDVAKVQVDMDKVLTIATKVGAVANHVGAKVILIIAGAVASTYGVTKVSETPNAPVPITVHRSAFDQAIDDCNKKASIEEREACAIAEARKRAR